VQRVRVIGIVRFLLNVNENGNVNESVNVNDASDVYVIVIAIMSDMKNQLFLLTFIIMAVFIMKTNYQSAFFLSASIKYPFLQVTNYLHSLIPSNSSPFSPRL